MHDNDEIPPVEGNPFVIRKITIRSLTGSEQKLVAGGTGTHPTDVTYRCTWGDCMGTDNSDYCNSNPDVCPTEHAEQCPASDPAFCNTLDDCTYGTGCGGGTDTADCTGGQTDHCGETNSCAPDCTAGHQTNVNCDTIVDNCPTMACTEITHCNGGCTFENFCDTGTGNTGTGGNPTFDYVCTS